MSRCFPFPPPGYDKKPSPEDAIVLKEEKQKEKKHKKEKKDKEKREGKEKRDKERSEGKHKDKRDKKDKHKDKKDKHREKKKEKDRGKEKEKSGTSEVSKVAGLLEAKSGEKLGPKERRDSSNDLDEKSHAAKFWGQNGEKPVQSNFLVSETEESKYVQELGRRIRDEDKVTSNQQERLSGVEKRRDEERETFSARNLGNSAEDKGKSKDRQLDYRKMDGQGYRGEARFTENSVSQSIAGAAKSKVAGMPRVVEKNDQRRMEGKEKTKEKDEKRGDKHMDKDRDKESQWKDKDKERKKEERTKEKSEHKKNELDKSKDVNRSNLTGIIDKKVSPLSLEHSNSANNAEGNLKKRKDIDINGFLHDKEIRPNKLLRPAPHPAMVNGRKLEAGQSPALFASDMPGVAANLKVDNKEHRKNGIIESQSLPISKQKPSSAAIVADQILEVSKKPPHPDSKYLSQVLSVPKMDEWSDFVDQEWLFGSQDLPSKKPEVGSIGVGEEPQVWSEALHLESADIVALPYVLPY